MVTGHRYVWAGLALNAMHNDSGDRSRTEEKKMNSMKSMATHKHPTQEGYLIKIGIVCITTSRLHQNLSYSSSRLEKQENI
jgi:hypothetical protein